MRAREDLRGVGPGPPRDSKPSRSSSERLLEAGEKSTAGHEPKQAPQVTHLEASMETFPSTMVRAQCGHLAAQRLHPTQLNALAIVCSAFETSFFASSSLRALTIIDPAP